MQQLESSDNEEVKEDTSALPTSNSEVKLEERKEVSATATNTAAVEVFTKRPEQITEIK